MNVVFKPLIFKPTFPLQQLTLARNETFLQQETADKKQTEPHLVNLNEDPMLSGVVFHYLSQAEVTVGRKDAQPVPTICLSGLR